MAEVVHARKEENDALESLVDRINTEEASEDVFTAKLPSIEESPEGPSGPLRAEVMRNVKLKVKVELGRTRMPLREALDLASGSVVDLGKKSGEAVDILVNDVPIARGQILVVDERFCIRVTEILSLQNPGEIR